MKNITSRITLTSSDAAARHLIDALKTQQTDTPETFIKLVVYGVSGVGKTRFCCSAAALDVMRPVFVIDCKGGLESAYEWSDNFTSYRPRSWDQFLAAVNYAREHANTIVIDDVEALYTLLLGDIMLEVIRSGSGKSRDEAVPAQREYGIALKLFDYLLTVLMDDSIHLLMNIVERQSGSDQRDFPLPLRPSLPGKAANLLCKTVSTVLYARAARPSRESLADGRVMDTHMHSRMTNRFFAKTRTLIKDPLVNPIFSDFYKEWIANRQKKGGDNTKDAA